jgi:glycerol-1-phosphate dehydrogenase [NAD(P)+]
MASYAAWPEAALAESHTRELFADAAEILPIALEESRAKQIGREALATQLERLRQRWPILRERLKAQLVPFAVLQERLRLVGAPTQPEQIGVTRQRLRHSFARAQRIRRRFTVLDLAMRAGLLTGCLDAVFGPGLLSPVPCNL